MSAFLFRRLSIGRMPGVSAGFELRGLAAGVNLVHGPNGSGKTTTARAVEALLWPKAAAPAGAALEGAAELAESRWSIRLDAGLVEYQENGTPSPPLAAASVEGRDRYRLWLPDLLQAEDSDFARAILIESSGGYDLEAAGRMLERRRSLRQPQQLAELRQARERVGAARRTQEALSEESGQLGAKEARLAGRPVLEERQQLMRLAVEHAERQVELVRAREGLASYPEVLARLQGDEAERVAEVRRRIAEAEVRRATAEKLAGGAGRELERFARQAAVLDGDVLQRLTADVDRLAELDRQILDEEKQSAAAAARLAEEESAFQAVVDRNRLAKLDLTGLGAFVRATEMAEEARSQRRALEAELSMHPDTPPPTDLEQRYQGVLLLKQWLAASPEAVEAEERFRRLGLLAGGIAAIAGLSLLLVGSGYLALAVGLAALAIVVAVLRHPRRIDARPHFEREYLRLGILEAPDRWESGVVEGCLASVEASLARGRELDRAWQRRQQILGRLAEVRDQESESDAGIRQLAAEFGLDVQGDRVRLVWLGERVSRWQRARAERLAAEKSLVTVCAAQKSAVELANGRLAGLGLEPVTETAALKGAVEKLRQEVASRERAVRQLDGAQIEIEREGAEIERLEAEIRRMLERVAVAPEDEPRLVGWCARVEAYREQRRACDLAEGERSRLEDRLRRHPGFEDSLLNPALQELGTRLAEVEGELAQLHALAEEVGALRTRIEHARTGHALEDALAEEDRCREALLELRSRELRAAIGAVLLQHVERETRNEHLPQVFHRADQLFRLVTQGAYELRVSPGEQASFRAYDTRLERGLALEELSSATRVQLLLAVRIAFVEAREAGVALPLLMDETLANSDDERAGAIIEAVIQLARQGRQIFYFTAQPDEVVKWQRALEAHPEVEWARIDLGEVRGLEQRIDLARLQPPVVSRPAIPAPEGRSHMEFGRLLQPPRIDLHAPFGGLHLWYLVEDPDLLYRILEELRIERWGELRSLWSAGGTVLLASAEVETIQAVAGIAAAALDRLRIGRGPVVTREALVASGAVSERFVDQVDELRRRCGSDANRLVAQLDERAVSGFLRRNVEALRRFLEEEGYLDPREPLSLQLVRRGIMAEQASAIAARRVDVAAIDRVLLRLLAGAGIDPEVHAERATDQPQLWPQLLA